MGYILLIQTIGVGATCFGNSGQIDAVGTTSGLGILNLTLGIDSGGWLQCNTLMGG